MIDYAKQILRWPKLFPVVSSWQKLHVYLSLGNSIFYLIFSHYFAWLAALREMTCIFLCLRPPSTAAHTHVLTHVHTSYTALSSFPAVPDIIKYLYLSIIIKYPFSLSQIKWMICTHYFSVEYLAKEESSEIPGPMRNHQLLKFFDRVCLVPGDAGWIYCWVIQWETTGRRNKW